MFIIVIGFFALFIVGYAFTHPILFLRKLAKGIAVIIGFAMMFITISVAAPMGPAWAVCSAILMILAFVAANKLSVKA